MAKRPENPVLVARNKANKEFWAKRDREISTFIEKNPTAVVSAQIAVKDEEVSLISRGIDPFHAKAMEHHILRAIEAEKRTQSERAKHPRRLKPDEIEAFILSQIKRNVTDAKAIWSALLAKIDDDNEHGLLRAADDDSAVWTAKFEKDGTEKHGRPVSANSFPNKVTNTRKKFHR